MIVDVLGGKTFSATFRGELTDVVHGEWSVARAHRTPIPGLDFAERGDPLVAFRALPIQVRASVERVVGKADPTAGGSDRLRLSNEGMT